MVKTGQFTTGCKGDRVLCPRNGGVRACVCVCLCVCVRVFLCVSSYLLAFLSALLDGIKAAFIGTKHFRTNIRTIVYFLVVANKRYTNTQTYTHTHRQTHGSMVSGNQSRSSALLHPTLPALSSFLPKLLEAPESRLMCRKQTFGLNLTNLRRPK